MGYCPEDRRAEGLFLDLSVRSNLLALTQLATIPDVFVWLAWLFVILRLGHALIHTTTNDMSRRFFLFLGSAIVLLLMWLVFFLRIAFGT